MRIISHDGIARQSLVRYEIKSAQTCSWCGGKNARGRLYNYAIMPDGSGATRQIKGYFCSIGCMRAYHA